MSSSYEYGQQLKADKEGVEALTEVMQAVQKLTPDAALHAKKCFHEICWRLDRLPMTRADRAEVDDLLWGIEQVMGGRVK
jgi:hypothetical protein